MPTASFYEQLKTVVLYVFYLGLLFSVNLKEEVRNRINIKNNK